MTQPLEWRIALDFWIVIGMCCIFGGFLLDWKQGKWCAVVFAGQVTLMGIAAMVKTYEVFFFTAFCWLIVAIDGMGCVMGAFVLCTRKIKLDPNLFGGQTVAEFVE